MGSRPPRDPCWQPDVRPWPDLAQRARGVGPAVGRLQPSGDGRRGGPEDEDLHRRAAVVGPGRGPLVGSWRSPARSRASPARRPFAAASRAGSRPPGRTGPQELDDRRSGGAPDDAEQQQREQRRPPAPRRSRAGDRRRTGLRSAADEDRGARDEPPAQRAPRPHTVVRPVGPLRLDQVDQHEARRRRSRGPGRRACGGARRRSACPPSSTSTYGVRSKYDWVDDQPVRARLVRERPAHRVRDREDPAPAGPQHPRHLAHHQRRVGDERHRAERRARQVERAVGEGQRPRRPARAAPRPGRGAPAAARAAACRPRGRAPTGSAPCAASQRAHWRRAAADLQHVGARRRRRAGRRPPRAGPRGTRRNGVAEERRRARPGSRRRRRPTSARLARGTRRRRPPGRRRPCRAAPSHRGRSPAPAVAASRIWSLVPAAVTDIVGTSGADGRIAERHRGSA